MALDLLGYRPWQGTLHSRHRSVWPVARFALRMIFRQKLFWVLYLVSLFNFIIFFGGIYLFSQLDPEMLPGDEGMGRVFGIAVKVQQLKDQFQKTLKLAGDSDTYRNFFWFQGYFVMAVLALAGSTLIGNDYRHGSLPFYLSKPMSRWHYLLGKFLAVALFSSMLTTLPALVLFSECYLVMPGYLEKNGRLFWGILGYGLAIAATLSVVVVALASWLRRTAALIAVWTGLLVFLRFLTERFVDRLGYNPLWRLFDLWNDLYVVGCWCLNTTPALDSYMSRPGHPVPQAQPEPWQAALTLLGVILLCLIYLDRRIRAVEVVR
jgi:ABC-type transport system involved in multi-copper enzyme maturation permease subunit